ncbi:MAG TPA: hypothetical protein VN704_01035 [Verrucomicrobiae bacterium]|nr:hypothetical protein [Verrucomicrobiae bacterium]
MLQSRKLPPGFLGFDILIILFFLFFNIVSFVINGWGIAISFNHTVAYLSTFLLFYITIKFTLFNISDKNLLFKRILQFISYTTIISALYGNVEFISSNVFGVNLNDYIPRPAQYSDPYTPVVLSLFYRSRGFAYESGVYTQMLELFAPLTIYYLFFSRFCKWTKSLKIFLSITLFLSFVFAASSATFVALPIAVFITCCFYIKRIYYFLRHRSFFYYLKGIIVLIIIYIINNYLSLYSSILLSLTEKMNSYSMYDRQNRIDFFNSTFSKFTPLKKMIGQGPAATDIIGVDGWHVVVSLYYNVTFELGFIGLFLLVFLFGYISFYTLSIKSKIGFFLNIAVISGIIHYYVVHDFWVPWVWFIAVFSIFFKKKFDSGKKNLL